MISIVRNAAASLASGALMAVASLALVVGFNGVAKADTGEVSLGILCHYSVLFPNLCVCLCPLGCDYCSGSQGCNSCAAKAEVSL